METLKSLLSNKTLVLCVLMFALGSGVTYKITADYTSKQYEKTVESQRDEITKLESTVTSLQSEIIQVKSEVTVVEKFDKDTGKIIERKKETKNETSTETKKEEKTDTKKETEVKTDKKTTEKEVIVNNAPKNHVHFGFGLNQDLNKMGQLGYSRSLGLFDVGGAVQSDQQFKDKSVMVTVGFSF